MCRVLARDLGDLASAVGIVADAAAARGDEELRAALRLIARAAEGSLEHADKLAARGGGELD